MKSPPCGGRVKSYYRPKGTALDSEQDVSKAVDNLSITRAAASNSFKPAPHRSVGHAPALPFVSIMCPGIAAGFPMIARAQHPSSGL